MPKDLDHILEDWPYKPGEVQARLLHAEDGREVIQVRVDLGVLQLEVEKRPDGMRPYGYETYSDYLKNELLGQPGSFVLSDLQQSEVDREFLQYYQRRICWLAIRKFERAVSDADHNLELLDCVGQCAPSEQWLAAHEQYRPFILFHRTQAASMAHLEAGRGPEDAVQEINRGLDRLRGVFEQHSAEDLYEENEMVQRLIHMRDALREEYEVGLTLEEQLEQAIEEEDYELAAKLRDQLANREKASQEDLENPEGM
ncbi:DNA helicase UvrBC [Planctomycetales bacterium 10988]|nr:DNA helicase UvrBC [Planctomycetales bacterium 10988]